MNRYVASRSGGDALPTIDQLAEPEPRPSETTPMAATKRKTYSAEERKAILAKLGKGKSDEKVAEEEGVGISTLWIWKKAAGMVKSNGASAAPARKAKRRNTKRVYSADFKRRAVDRVLVGRANRTESQRKIADDLGIAETMLSAWVRVAGIAKADAPTNGASPGQSKVDASPTIEIKGLRAWVERAVDEHLARRFKSP